MFGGRYKQLLIIVGTALKVLLVLGCCTGVVVYAGRPFIGIWRYSQYAKRQRQRLLHETDHAALLAACRDVMEHRRTFRQEERGMAVGPDGKVRPALEDERETVIDPKDPRLPAIIRELKPTDIHANDQWLSIELLGGFDHCGVHAFAEGVKGFGDRELVNGLWYFSDD